MYKGWRSLAVAGNGHDTWIHQPCLRSKLALKQMMSSIGTELGEPTEKRRARMIHIRGSRTRGGDYMIICHCKLPPCWQRARDVLGKECGPDIDMDTLESSALLRRPCWICLAKTTTTAEGSQDAGSDHTTVRAGRASQQFSANSCLSSNSVSNS